jgi:hypothetical protein
MPRTLVQEETEIQERRSLGRSVIAAASALQESLGMLISPLVGLPYLIWFAAQLLLMGAYLSLHTGPAASFWAWFVPGVPAEALRHYPDHLILMQAVLNRIEMLLDVIVRCVFHGATIIMIREVFRGRRPGVGDSFGRSIKRYRDLFLVSLISAAAVYAVVSAGRQLTAGITGPARFAAASAWVAAGLVTQAFFVYALPYVVLEGRSFAGALWGGIKLTARLATKTILIVLIPFVLTLPTMLLSLKAEMIALRLSPGFMIHLHVADKVMELVSMYLITAGATVIFMKRTERRVGRGSDTGAAAGSET